jgi:hypothetical protein
MNNRGKKPRRVPVLAGTLPDAQYKINNRQGRAGLPQEKILAPGPIGKNGMIDHFSAGATFPGIKGSDEIIIFFSVHPTLAFGTSHVFPLVFEIMVF